MRRCPADTGIHSLIVFLSADAARNDANRYRKRGNKTQQKTDEGFPKNTKIRGVPFHSQKIQRTQA